MGDLSGKNSSLECKTKRVLASLFLMGHKTESPAPLKLMYVIVYIRKWAKVMLQGVTSRHFTERSAMAYRNVQEIREFYRIVSRIFYTSLS